MKQQVFNMNNKNIGEIYDLYSKIFKYFANAGRSFSVSTRDGRVDILSEFICNEFGFNNKREEFWKGWTLLGHDGNSIGPNGTSDFWDYDEDGEVYKTDLPETEASIFVDAAYGVIVVR